MSRFLPSDLVTPAHSVPPVLDGLQAPGRDEGAEGEWLEGLRRLPQPLHLLEFAVRSQHYHFGCFESAADSVRRAQDRMSLWNVHCFPAGSAVLDIGCGLGGTSRLLAGMGLSVTAIDPCHEAVAYARMRARSPGAGLRPRFMCQSLEDFSRAPGPVFDGALGLEILQHFRQLPAFFAGCRRFLRPGGLLVLHDLAIHVEVDWAHVPYHRAGHVHATAEACGFRLVEHEDLTRAVLPTLPCLAAALEDERARLVAGFARQGRPVEREFDELLLHMRDLQGALQQGLLSYETLVLSLQPDAR